MERDCISIFSQAIEKVGVSKLHMAAMQNDARAIKHYLKEGIDVNLKSSDGTTPLHQAVFFEGYEATHVLIDNGADINVKDYRGDTPLHAAVLSANINILELLILSGANLKAKNHDGLSPYELALDVKRNVTSSKAKKIAFAGFNRNLIKCIEILKQYETDKDNNK